MLVLPSLVSPGSDHSKFQLTDRFAVPVEPGPVPDSEVLADRKLPVAAEEHQQIPLKQHCEFLVQLQFPLLHLWQYLVTLLLVQLVVPALGSRLSNDRGIPW